MIIKESKTKKGYKATLSDDANNTFAKQVKALGIFGKINKAKNSATQEIKKTLHNLDDDVKDIIKDGNPNQEEKDLLDKFLSSDIDKDNLSEEIKNVSPPKKKIKPQKS